MRWLKRNTSAMVVFCRWFCNSFCRSERGQIRFADAPTHLSMWNDSLLPLASRHRFGRTTGSRAARQQMLANIPADRGNSRLLPWKLRATTRLGSRDHVKGKTSVTCGPPRNASQLIRHHETITTRSSHNPIRNAPKKSAAESTAAVASQDKQVRLQAANYLLDHNDRVSVVDNKIIACEVIARIHQQRPQLTSRVKGPLARIPRNHITRNSNR